MHSCIRTVRSRTFLKTLALLALLIGPQKLTAAGDDSLFISLTRTPLAEEKLPTNTSVVTQEQIKQSGAQNAGQAVQYLPGVHLQTYSGLGSLALPRLRGFVNKQVAVYVDNRRVPRDVTGDVDLSQIPAESIDRIEIVRGAGSVLYGPDAEGGIIHVITKKAKGYQPVVEVSAQAGSFDTQVYQASVGTKKERVEGFFTASRNHSNNFQRNSNFENASFGGNVGYDAGLLGKTMLYFTRSQSQVGLPGGTTVPINEWDGEIERLPRNAFQKQNDVNSSVQLEHEVDILGKAKLTSRLAATEIVREQLSTTTGPVTDRSRLNRRSLYVQGDAAFGFTAGFEYIQEQIRSPFTVIPQTNGYGILFQQRFELGNFTAIPGVRYDNNTEWGDAANPRLALIYQAAPWLKLSGNVGRAFQAPTFADMADYDGATFALLQRPSTASALVPEESWHYDVGAEIRPSDNFWTKVTLYRADIRNRFSYGFTPDGSRFTTSNLQKGFNQGVEAELGNSIGAVFSHYLSYTYLQSEGKGLVSSITGEDYSKQFVELEFVPRNRVTYNATFRLPFHVELNQNLLYVGEQWSSANRRGIKLPDTLLWDMSAAWRWRELYFQMGVKNVTERRYVERASFGTYFPQPERTYWGGVTVRFL